MASKLIEFGCGQKQLLLRKLGAEGPEWQDVVDGDGAAGLLGLTDPTGVAFGNAPASEITRILDVFRKRRSG